MVLFVLFLFIYVLVLFGFFFLRSFEDPRRFVFRTEERISKTVNNDKLKLLATFSCDHIFSSSKNLHC